MKQIISTFAIGILAATPAFAAKIAGTGASFPDPVYQSWSAGYNKATGNQVNYNAIGSSGGIKQIKAKTVIFGATDAPMKAADLEKYGMVQFPTVIGGVVPIVNINGVSAGKMKLTGNVLADIYLGKIKTWNDPAIQKLNPGVRLPSSKIITVHRSDGSGTTHIFSTYLSQVSSTWKSSVGVSKSLQWPTDKQGTGSGAKGNAGIAGLVKRVPNSIGYVEYAYAKQNKLAYTKLQNLAGNFVSPSDDTFAAAANVDWTKHPGFALTITNQGHRNAWPISSATFILMYKNPADKAQSKEALKFFDWAYTHGDSAAKALDFVPLPAKTKNAVRAEWKKIK